MTNPEQERAPAPRTVLVVEDDVLIRLLICDAMRDAGLRVVEVGDAAQALGYLKTDPDVRLVFSDVRMPGSMDGLELARRIGMDFPRIKVVLTSGQVSRPDDIEAGIPLITKPYRVEATAARIVALLDQADPIGR